MAKKQTDPQVQFLVMSLTNVVTEAVQAKCEGLTSRERKTLERRILKAVQMFVARPNAPAARTRNVKETRVKSPATARQ